MTTNTQPVSTRAEFEQRIAQLVEDAARNGVDPRGGWATTATEDVRYEALITAVASG
ncbi:hypothetical protein [Halomarina oriensis]|uniref:Uncharacterized protein n=1 Tax=Halomarina oriensis TaxID=671145 RepID=A0A6B0GSP2_9EURY|nr:hypothetical protein [Halomarina oriensis]MWG35653.1 hypothetical protein [Halomarina oriensis]